MPHLKPPYYAKYGSYITTDESKINDGYEILSDIESIIIYDILIAYKLSVDRISYNKWDEYVDINVYDVDIKSTIFSVSMYDSHMIIYFGNCQWTHKVNYQNYTNINDYIVKSKSGYHARDNILIRLRGSDI